MVGVDTRRLDAQLLMQITIHVFIVCVVASGTGAMEAGRYGGLIKQCHTTSNSAAATRYMFHGIPRRDQLTNAFLVYGSPQPCLCETNNIIVLCNNVVAQRQSLVLDGSWINAIYPKILLHKLYMHMVTFNPHKIYDNGHWIVYVDMYLPHF